MTPRPLSTRTLHALGCGVVLGLFTLGCGEDEVVAPVAATPRKKAAEAAPAPLAQGESYSYSPLNKRDPFRGTSVSEPGIKVPNQDSARVDCSEPLCLVSIDELSVVAVVSGDANPLAMVEDRNGVGYIIRRYTRVGKQGGQVSAISRDCVDVRSFAVVDGKPSAVIQKLCVKTDSASAPVLDLFKNKQFVP